MRAAMKRTLSVLHCFQKKTRQTGENDIKPARKPFKGLMRKQP